MSPRYLLAFSLAFVAVIPAGAESFKSWAARGAREEREKDPKAAFSSYSNALSLWDKGDGGLAKAKVLCARASLREKDGDEAGAIEDLSACLALDKKNAKAFHRRGQLRFKSRKAQAAIGDFYRAIAIDIRFGEAYADRARAYESQSELGFAHEDYSQACRLGVKAACAKAKSLSPSVRPQDPAAKAKAKPKAPPPPEDADAEAPPAAPEAAKPAPAPAPKPASYRPKFKDCLASLEDCVDNGDSFGACVRRAPDCDAKAVKGCCPGACLKAYQKSLNRDRSEAQAYREHFVPGSSCGAPPKEEEEE
ncbi:MAG: hypothetical protein Q8T11_06575 [Elusimicrobiota bacterium]|nr:hypothetical protein [Elusimicrobiota bacterium]